MNGSPNWNAEYWLRRGLQATVVIGLVVGALSSFESHARQQTALNLWSARVLDRAGHR
ncbi:MAG TPA: hypothetical protein VJ501_03590 [Burkholderiaceae bacterium]|nr:hypothetical protein [Burkholderiaceae bacterium]